MILHQVSPAEWSTLSRDAFVVTFGQARPAELDRIDFALLAAESPDSRPGGFITCQERDRDTLYWQFGGTFPGTRGTASSFRYAQAALRWCQERYRQVTLSVHNQNTVMLKMALALGFRIVGVRVVSGDIFVEHLLEFHGGSN
jgi:RimJ/RimL family protein N-acetyltransferase